MTEEVQGLYGEKFYEQKQIFIHNPESLCEQKENIQAQYRTQLCEQKAIIQVRAGNKRVIVKQVCMYTTNRNICERNANIQTNLYYFLPSF
jgi:hypothetical protein